MLAGVHNNKFPFILVHSAS